jgi:hypothetical protein
MEELLSSALREVADGSLGNAILEVGVDPTKDDFLALSFAGLAEHAVREATIVAVVVVNLYAVFGSKLLKRALCIDSFC